jgi:hypothetical protein
VCIVCGDHELRPAEHQDRRGWGCGGGAHADYHGELHEQEQQQVAHDTSVILKKWLGYVEWHHDKMRMRERCRAGEQAATFLKSKKG